MPRLLLCSPLFPDGYASQAWDNPVTDFGDLQFTGYQDLFTLHGHMHEQFAHVIAQNLATPSVYLEYPRREQFLEEIDKGYDVVGIHLFYNQVERWRACTTTCAAPGRSTRWSTRRLA